MPETVEDDGEKSDGTPSEDMESAIPSKKKQEGVKFGWIRGVLVSYITNMSLCITVTICLSNTEIKMGLSRVWE